MAICLWIQFAGLKKIEEAKSGEKKTTSAVSIMAWFTKRSNSMPMQERMITGAERHGNWWLWNASERIQTYINACSWVLSPGIWIGRIEFSWSTHVFARSGKPLLVRLERSKLTDRAPLDYEPIDSTTESNRLSIWQQQQQCAYGDRWFAFNRLERPIARWLEKKMIISISVKKNTIKELELSQTEYQFAAFNRKVSNPIQSFWVCFF